MKYVRDEVVDEIVERDEELQAVVQGRQVMLWRPGQTVGLAVQASLTLGWIGLSLGLFWLFTPSVRTFAFFIGGAFLGAAPINWISYQMVRGWPAARAYMYRFSVVTAIMSGLSVALGIFGSNNNAAILTIVGFVFNIVAMRLVAGKKYALLSATFRAQRKHLALVDRTREVPATARDRRAK
jgi:hypothetical protein